MPDTPKFPHVTRFPLGPVDTLLLSCPASGVEVAVHLIPTRQEWDVSITDGPHHMIVGGYVWQGEHRVSWNRRHDTEASMAEKFPHVTVRRDDDGALDELIVTVPEASVQVHLEQMDAGAWSLIITDGAHRLSVDFAATWFETIAVLVEEDR